MGSYHGLREVSLTALLWTGIELNYIVPISFQIFIFQFLVLAEDAIRAALKDYKTKKEKAANAVAQ